MISCEAIDVKIRRNFHLKAEEEEDPTKSNNQRRRVEKKKKCRKGDDVTRDSKFKEIRWFVKCVLKAVAVIDFTVKRLHPIGIFEVKPATTKERKQKKKSLKFFYFFLWNVLLLLSVVCCSHYSWMNRKEVKTEKW